MTFFIIVFSIYLSMHLLVWWRTAVQLCLGFSGALIIVPLILLLTVSPILIHNLPENWSRELIRAAWWSTYIWTGIIFYLFWLQLGTLVLDGMAGLFFRSSARGGWQAWPMTAAVAALTLFTVISGLSAASRIHVKTIEISSARLELPIRLVHVSDTHLGAMTSRAQTARLVELIRQQGADMVLFTGDQVNDHLAWLEPDARLLASIAPRYGMYGVLGNHEYYVGTPDSLAFHAAADIMLLRNAVTIVPEPGIQLLGINDPAWAFTDRDYMARQFDALVPELAPDRFTILLTHRPWIWDEKAIPAGVDLQLSGHTHNGQIFPFMFFVKRHYPYIYGHYRSDDQHLIVTSGAGFWGPPLRVFSRSEIVVIDLLPRS